MYETKYKQNEIGASTKPYQPLSFLKAKAAQTNQSPIPGENTHGWGRGTTGNKTRMLLFSSARRYNKAINLSFHEH